MKINIEIDQIELKKLVIQRLTELMPGSDFTSENVLIEVKSTQNYKAEWEIAAFRARVVQVL